MIKFFRRIRGRLLSEGRLGKYLLYAVGEILLVVVGILIALSINNKNELSKQRAKELHYLKNIKVDLKMKIAHLDDFIATRDKAIASANTIIAHYEGEPVTDLESDSAKLYVPDFQWNNGRTQSAFPA